MSNEQKLREAFERWYESDPCHGIEPTWAAFKAGAAYQDLETGFRSLSEKEQAK